MLIVPAICPPMCSPICPLVSPIPPIPELTIELFFGFVEVGVGVGTGLDGLKSGYSACLPAPNVVPSAVPIFTLGFRGV